MPGPVLDRLVCCGVAGAFLFAAAGAIAQEPQEPFAPSPLPMPAVETPHLLHCPRTGKPPHLR
jgi:hypothetical protein